MAWINVEVPLDEVDDSDLIEELEDRGYGIVRDTEKIEVNDLVRKVYERRRVGLDYQKELDTLIWHCVGRIA